MASEIGEELATLNYGGIKSTLYWLEDEGITIEDIDLGNDTHLLRGAKCYYVSETVQETMQSRLESIGVFSDYLKREWPSFELSILYINKLSTAMAEVDKTELKKQVQGKEGQIRSDKLQLEKVRKDIEFKLASPDDARSLESKISETEKEVQELKIDLDIHDQLEREFKKSGSAAAFIVKRQSDVHECSSLQIQDTVKLIAKRLNDDSVVIKEQARKGCGIGLEELNVPHLAWLSESLGIMDPTSLEALIAKYPALAPLKDGISKMFTRKWAEEAQVGSHKYPSSAAHAQAIANLLSRTAGTKDYLLKSPDWKKLPQYNKELRQGILGFVADGNLEVTNYPFYVDYDIQTHYAVLGMSRSGKTVGASVLVEGALEQGIPVVVIDPTGSWTGLLEKCDEKEFLDLYADFYMEKEKASGYAGKIYTPASDVGLELSTNLFAPPDTADENELQVSAINIAEQVGKICDLAEKEKTKLADILVTAWKKGEYLEYEEVIDQAEGLFEKKLADLRAYHFLFQGEPIKDITDLWKEKEVTVVSLNHLEQSQRIWATYYLLRKIADYFERQGETKEANLIVVVEEVHQFQIPENKEAYRILEKATRELLKRGLRLVLVTQKLTDLEPALRLNIGSWFYFRQTEETERQNIANDLGGEFKDAMGKLPDGMAAIRMPDQQPFLAQFRPPFHRMKQLTDAETAEQMIKWKEQPVVFEKEETDKGELTDDEAVFLEAVKNYYDNFKKGPYFAEVWKHQLKWTSARRAMKVKQSLIDKGLIREEDDGKLKRLIPI